MAPEMEAQRQPARCRSVEALFHVQTNKGGGAQTAATIRHGMVQVLSPIVISAIAVSLPSFAYSAPDVIATIRARREDLPAVMLARAKRGDRPREDKASLDVSRS